MSDYKLDSTTIDKIVDRFKSRGWNGVGDRQLGTQEKVREILEAQM